MATDLDIIEGLREAFGTKQPATAASMTQGLAASNSEDGRVWVQMDGGVVSGDGEQRVEIDTEVDVREGDVVTITITDGYPVVTGVTGGGDRAAAETAAARSTADAASTAASQAKDAADAAQQAATETAQHFFADDSGAHVSTVAGEASSGANLLLKSDKVALRDGSEDVIAMDASANAVSIGKQIDWESSGDYGGTIAFGDQQNAISSAINEEPGSGQKSSSLTFGTTVPSDTIQHYGIGDVSVFLRSELEGFTSAFLLLHTYYLENGYVSAAHIEADDIAVGSESSTVYIAGHEVKNRDLVTWTSFNKPVSKGSATFSVRNGVAALVCDFCCKNAMSVYSASQMLTTAQVAELWKYAPVDNNMKMTGFDDHKNIWTLSFGGDGNVYLWATSGSVAAGTYLTTSFMWVVG